MKRILLGSLALISIFSSSLLAQPARSGPSAAQKPAAAQTATAARQDFEVPFVNKTLANGLEVIVLPDSGVPLVTVELAVRNGSFTEPPELNGLSHLYEHMFFKPNQGTLLAICERSTFGIAQGRCNDALKSKPVIGDVSFFRNIDSLGITYNGSTREEVVNYYFTTTSPYLETAIKFINVAVRYPLFNEQELEEEKRVVIGELDRQEANPFSFLSEAMNDKLYYKHPSRKKPGGSKESVAAATTEKMRTIQSRYYFPNNSALVVTGDVKPDEVFRIAEQIMGSWEKRAVDPFKEFPLVEHPPLAKSEAVVLEKDTGAGSQGIQNVFIQIGWHGPSIGKDDKGTYAADVFSYILQQPDSRFQRNLVDSGLAAGVSFNYYTQRNVGPITALLVTTPENAKAALKALYAEIAAFSRPDYFSDAELENSKTILENNDLFEREKPSEYAHTLGFWWSSTGIDYFRGYHRNLRSVNRADLNRYIDTYIKGKPHVGIALLSPDGKAKAGLTETDLIGTN